MIALQGRSLEPRWSRKAATFFMVVYDGASSHDKDRIHCRISGRERGNARERERERQGLFWRETRPAKIEVGARPPTACDFVRAAKLQRENSHLRTREEIPRDRRRYWQISKL